MRASVTFQSSRLFLQAPRPCSAARRRPTPRLRCPPPSDRPRSREATDRTRPAAGTRHHGPQMVLTKPHRRHADRPRDPRSQIASAADVIDHLAGGRTEKQTVEREVAAFRVFAGLPENVAPAGCRPSVSAASVLSVAIVTWPAPTSPSSAITPQAAPPGRVRARAQNPSAPPWARRPMRRLDRPESALKSSS